MAFQVDFTTKAARAEVKLLNTEIGFVTKNIKTAEGAAARLSKQARSMGGSQIKDLTTSVNNLNLMIKQTATNWARTQTVAAGATQKQTNDVKKLTAATNRLNRKNRAGRKASDQLGGSFHTTSQRAAAFRASMLGLNTHMGMFTARTLVAATTAYAFVRALRSTVSVGAEYEKSMQRVFAISNALGNVAGEVTPQMKMLDDAVRKVGKTTIFTAAEVAEGAVQFAMAGFNAKETSEALGATASLASIGMTDMGTAARTAANIINAFSMQASDLEMVVDKMSVAVTGSMMDIKQLGVALSFVGPLANETNTSFQDTVVILELMHDAGIKASKAGTAVRRGMVNMLNPTKKQIAVLSELNVATTTANGEQRSMLAIARDLANKGIKPAGVAALFGARAVAAWSQVIKEAKLEAAGMTSKLTEFEDAQKRSAGVSRELRQALERNLIDQFKLFRSAIQDVQQDLYIRFAPAVTSAVIALTEFVKSIKVDNIIRFFKALTLAVTTLVAAKVASVVLTAAVYALATGFTVAEVAALGLFRVLTILGKHPLLLAVTALTAGYYYFKDSAEAAATASDKATRAFERSETAILKATRAQTKMREIGPISERLAKLGQQAMDLRLTPLIGVSDKEKAEVKAALDYIMNEMDVLTKRKAKILSPAGDVEEFYEYGDKAAKKFVEGLRTIDTKKEFSRQAKDIVSPDILPETQLTADSSPALLLIHQDYLDKKLDLEHAYNAAVNPLLQKRATQQQELAVALGTTNHRAKEAAVKKTDEEVVEIENIYKKGYIKLEADRAKHLDAENKLELRAADKISKAREEYRSMTDLSKDFGLEFAKSMEDAIIAGEKFSDVLKKIGEDIARMILRKQILAPMMESIGGGSLQSMLGFADGGRPPLNQVSMVGEDGPELFVPDTAGTIVPNHKLSAGGDTTTVHQNISVDARGSSVSPAHLAQAVEEGAKRGYEKVVHDMMTNGPIKRTL